MYSVENVLNVKFVSLPSGILLSSDKPISSNTPVSYVSVSVHFTATAVRSSMNKVYSWQLYMPMRPTLSQ